MKRATLFATGVSLLIASVSAWTAERDTARTGDVLRLTIKDAVLFALENNPSVAVQRLNPAVKRTQENQEEAAFDPTLTGEAAYQTIDGLKVADTSSGVARATSEGMRGNVALEKLFPSGTHVKLDGNLDDTGTVLPALASGRAGLTVTQSLLKGGGSDVNLASVRQAALDTEISEYELRGFCEAFAAQVEKTCWDHVLSGLRIAILTESLRLANQQSEETSERIRVGKLPELELAAAKAEMALRREALINAQSALASVRLQLLRLLNPPGRSPWDKTPAVQANPDTSQIAFDGVEDHVQLALKSRPELLQARLGIARNDLELVKTRNGLLPKMDLFIGIGMTGYAESFAGSLAAKEGNGNDLSAGVRVEIPLGNRKSRAIHERAALNQIQASQALENLTQLVQLDVRTAHVEVTRAREQIPATQATRRLQEEKLRAEQEKFRTGKSTSLNVAQAQRDLTESQLAEVQAVATCFKALVDLYRLDGSLLTRRGVRVESVRP